MTKSKWEDDLCYTSPIFHEHVVNGKTHKFYPVSVGLIMKLKVTAKKITKAVAAVFSNKTKDIKIIDSTTTSGGNGPIERTVVTEPIDLGIAKYRDEQRSNSLAEALEALTDSDTLELLAEIIMDSMADVFKKNEEGKVVEPTPAVFVAKTKLTTMSQMVIGVAKGNQDVFGPLGSKVGSFLGGLEKAVTSKITALTVEKVTTTTTPANAN